MDNDVIVIGAGASGMVAAISAARNGKKVLVIERMPKVGKKIYATGNGKCNYTNTNYDYDCYRGMDTSIVDTVLGKFSYLNTIEFFDELGILAKNKNGYIYPYSEQASSIVEVLQKELERLKVRVNLEENVLGVEIDNKENNKDKNKKVIYTIKTDKGLYKTNKVILATGGKASPKLGSDGSGIAIAKKLGHKIINPNKALVQLKCRAKSLKSIAGVRLQAKVKLIVVGKTNDYMEYNNQGEIIFTDYGISGIPVMQLSRYASEALSNNKKVRIELDLFPDIDYAELLSLLKERKRRNPNKDNYELLIGMLNNKLGAYIVKNLINDEKKCADNNMTIKQKVNNKKTKNNEMLILKNMVGVLKSMELEVIDTNSWDNAQVMAGGVSTHQIHSKTMESKVCKGLYITGELMDVDGTCGGYNLQWAWATGYIAGSNI